MCPSSSDSHAQSHNNPIHIFQPHKAAHTVLFTILALIHPSFSSKIESKYVFAQFFKRFCVPCVVFCWLLLNAHRSLSLPMHSSTASGTLSHPLPFFLTEQHHLQISCFLSRYALPLITGIRLTRIFGPTQPSYYLTRYRLKFQTTFAF